VKNSEQSKIRTQVKREGPNILQTVPNPTTGDFWFTTDAPVGTPWVLTSAFGQVMQRGEVNSSYWVRVDAGSMEPGLYLFTVQTNKPVSNKLLKL
jgi:hypothetical protein